MCDILLISPPANGIYVPPHGISLLKAHLKKNGLHAKCIDYNILFYRQYQNSLGPLWDSDQQESWTNELHYLEKIHPLFKKFSKIIAKDILSNEAKTVGLSVNRASLFPAIDIIRTIEEFFKNDVAIIIGGPEAKNSSHLFQKFTSVVTVIEGEGESALANYLKKKKNDPVAPTETKMTPPDYSDFQLGRYPSKELILPISLSIGCPFHCSFCIENTALGPYRKQDPTTLYQTMKKLNEQYHAKFFQLTDSILPNDPLYLNQMTSTLIENSSPFEFGLHTTVYQQPTSEFFNNLYQAGCRHVHYGVESGSEYILKKMNKPFTVANAIQTIRLTHHAGIKTQVSIIVGHPEESFFDFLKTLFLVFRLSHSIDSIAINLFSFLPGSIDYKRAQNIKNIESLYWTGPLWHNKHSVRNLKKTALKSLFLLFKRIHEQD